MAITTEQRQRALKLRAAIDVGIAAANKQPIAINGMLDVIRQWTPDTYTIGDVRIYESIPYKCVQAHDSTANPTWTPSTTASLWMQYHGTSIETARNWIAPAGAHDMYKIGEYMIWTNGLVYKCVQDTVYDPTAYTQAWEVQENV